jgi:CDP-2,3-bis-(O-geranylgeranyl)-sn-glycerol synthase
LPRTIAAEHNAAVDEWYRRLVALLLVIVANVAPWAAGRLFGARGAAPLDFGMQLRDGTRALGAHKTWRGLISGALGCGLASLLCSYSFLLGAVFGALSLLADAASSFVKRRLGTVPGTELPLLDQLPEALLPLLILSGYLKIGLIDCLGIAAVFLLLDLAATRLRHPVNTAKS